MDADDSPAPKGSLRKFLEHLSGAGKAIGVLTSGGDAQVGLRPSPPASADRKDQEAGTPGRQRRRGAGSGLPLPCNVEAALQEGPEPGPTTRARREDI
ncbi:uncharacterized protein isoform X1 [Macaca fascicularis]|uniref:uncharacterized protein isoform X1 n=1 Tax=Macaca fascicularis TaxID=9541 RepID=UPI003D15D0FB